MDDRTVDGNYAVSCDREMKQSLTIILISVLAMAWDSYGIDETAGQPRSIACHDGAQVRIGRVESGVMAAHMHTGGGGVWAGR